MAEQTIKRILYYTPEEWKDSEFPEGEKFNIDKVEVLCAYNYIVADRMLRNGPFDLIGVHHDSVATYRFAENARARYHDALIIGLSGAAPKNWKETVKRGLGENNVFDDIIKREMGIYDAINEGVEKVFRRNLENLVKILKENQEKIIRARIK